MRVRSTEEAERASAARLLHPSRARADRPIGPEALTHIAEGLAMVVDPNCGFEVQEGDVRREKILATSAYDAWIVTVGPRTSIEPHDHEGSLGVLTVTHGRLIEFGLDEGGRRRSRLRLVGVGETRTFGVVERHSLLNPDLGPATSVQVFSPPLDSTEAHDASRSE